MRDPLKASLRVAVMAGLVCLKGPCTDLVDTSALK